VLASVSERITSSPANDQALTVHQSGPTLASYNAGPNRVAEWMTWSTYREPAESWNRSRLTETRDYVQAVPRNADIYRRLYQ
jgi:soluble lytic murein transglycosylase-like protein